MERDPDDLSSTQISQIDAAVDRVTANVASDPALFEVARACALDAVDQYRRAHAALGLAIRDFGARDVVQGSEALTVFRQHLEAGDALRQEAGRTVFFGSSEGGKR